MDKYEKSLQLMNKYFEEVSSEEFLKEFYRLYEIHKDGMSAQLFVDKMMSNNAN